MPARLLPLIAVCLALAAPALGAPAPFRRTELEQRPVLLEEWLPVARVPVGEPSVVARQADWEAFAKTLGIQDPPRVDFRTHFLFVRVWTAPGAAARCEIDGSGDLHLAVEPERLRGQFGGTPYGPRYFIKSFRRSQVKTVNGLPLPR